MSLRHVVIGGGGSGLSCAILLAKQGDRVTLVEQAPRLAPLLRGFRRGEAVFDTGFHYAGGLAKGGLLERLFAYLGIDHKLNSYPLAADGYDIFRASDDGREFRFPSGVAALRTALRREFPNEGAGIDYYLELVEAVCNALPDLLRMQAALPKELRGLSLMAVLDQLFSDPHLKQLLSLHTLLYGVSPHEAAFEFHAGVAGLYYRSAHGIHGGGEHLANLLEGRLKELGVEILTGSVAAEICLDASRHVNAVRLADGRKLPCEGVIATVHPGQFLKMVPAESLRPIYRTRLASLEETDPALFLFGTSRTPLEMLQHSNYFTGPRWTDSDQPPTLTSLCYLTGARSRTQDQKLGLIAICPIDSARFAPWLERPSGNRPEAYRQTKQQVMQELLNRLRQSCPDIINQLEHIEGATPLTTRHYLGTPGGGLYGSKHCLNQHNPQARTRLGGVFLAGQSITAPGLLGATMSAFLTCSEVFGKRNLFEEVMTCP
jgi:phytoene dehydrogenase-like protein